MMPSQIWPIPQQVTWRDEALPLSRAALVLPARASAAEAAPAQLFADMVADEFGVVIPIVRGAAPAGRVPIEIAVAGQPGAGRTPADLPGAEGYLLDISAKGGRALGRDARGAQHAVATMIQLVERRQQEVVLRGAEIRDWPHKPLRMVHLYLPGPDHLGYARRYLRDFLVRYKFNGLFIECGGGVRLRSMPEIPVAWRRFVEENYAIGETSPIYGMNRPLGPGRRFPDSVHTHLADGRYLEPDDLRRLFDWARELNLEPVPEIQGLSHAYYLTGAHPEIAELAGAAFADAYCPSNPKSHELLFGVMEEYLEITQCRSVHIGRDEWRAGGLCPICREKDTGELFAHDALETIQWLKERGVGAWMWGDHLLRVHTATGSSHDDGTVWYDYPQTKKAAEIMAAAKPDVTILNWSWALGGAEETDEVFANLGFKQIYGNFHGRQFPNWPKRSAHPSVLGAGISSWCAWNDFELGMLHYPPALYAANMLWSNHWPSQEEADEAVAHQAPKLKDRMRRSWEEPRLWSVAAPSQRQHVVWIQKACNAPAKGEGWDLSGLRVGTQQSDGVPFEIADPGKNGGRCAIVAERRHVPAQTYPHSSLPIAIGGKYGSLIFWQMTTAPGAASAHVGDGTNFPHDATELIGWYEVVYADGLTHAVEIHYGESVGAWDEGFKSLYHAREVRVGELPDGKPLVMWGLEWTNPRAHVEIVSVTLHGARAVPEIRPSKRVSAARPMLLGITAIELPKWEDCRGGKAPALPGLGATEQTSSASYEAQTSIADGQQ